MARKKEKFGIRSGYQIKGNPQAIGEELEVLEKKNGGHKRDAIWKAARKKASAMHNNFTWDAKKAAEKCWNNEAGYLLQAITVVTYKIKEGAQQEVVVRGVIGVMDDLGNPYGPVTYHSRKKVLASVELRAGALKAAILYLKAACDKYRELTEPELGHIWKDIDDLDDVLKTL